MFTINLPYNPPRAQRAVGAALSGLMVLGALALSTAAHAEEPRSDVVHNDMVVLSQSTESWVETSTPRVTVRVEMAMDQKNSSVSRTEMNSALQKLAKADWRIVALDRGRDETGMERWSVEAEARLPENMTAGLFDKSRKVSRTGMQLYIDDISFDPTRAELEAARAKLRAKLYKTAMDELARLNKEVPNRKWRIGAIDFTGTMGVASPQSYQRGLDEIIVTA